jgi:uncharacterized protein
VVSELQNFLVGLNVFDRDIARAADLLGFSAKDADQLRKLAPGEFFAMGPALAPLPLLAKIDPTITEHLGATPELKGAADVDGDEAARLLDLAALKEVQSGARDSSLTMKGLRALDAFLLEPAAPTATAIVGVLRRIAPNATTAADLASHLGAERDAVDAGLDILAALSAVDTMPRGDDRIARLHARLRAKISDVAVVGLA